MKPSWDKLMEEFADDATKLVGDVDCTTDEGEKLCQEHGVEGFPTLKWGDPSNLEDYQGGREYEDLKAFAEENLKPVCGVGANIDLCDDEAKAKIEGFQKMETEELLKLVETEEEKIKKNEEHLASEIEKLQERYEELMKEKDEKDAAIKSAGLGFMKAVLAAKSEQESKSSSDEL